MTFRNFLFALIFPIIFHTAHGMEDCDLKVITPQAIPTSLGLRPFNLDIKVTIVIIDFDPIELNKIPERNIHSQSQVTYSTTSDESLHSTHMALTAHGVFSNAVFYFPKDGQDFKDLPFSIVIKSYGPVLSSSGLKQVSNKKSSQKVFADKFDEILRLNSFKMPKLILQSAGNEYDKEGYSHEIWKQLPCQALNYNTSLNSPSRILITLACDEYWDLKPFSARPKSQEEGAYCVTIPDLLLECIGKNTKRIEGTSSANARLGGICGLLQATFPYFDTEDLFQCLWRSAVKTVVDYTGNLRKLGDEYGQGVLIWPNIEKYAYALSFYKNKFQNFRNYYFIQAIINSNFISPFSFSLDQLALFSSPHYGYEFHAMYTSQLMQWVKNAPHTRLQEFFPKILTPLNHQRIINAWKTAPYIMRQELNHEYRLDILEMLFQIDSRKFPALAKFLYENRNLNVPLNAMVKAFSLCNKRWESQKICDLLDERLKELTNMDRQLAYQCLEMLKLYTPKYILKTLQETRPRSRKANDWLRNIEIYISSPWKY